MEHQNRAREQYQPGHPELDRQGQGLAEKDPAGSRPKVATDARVPAVDSMTWLRLIISRATNNMTR